MSVLESLKMDGIKLKGAGEEYLMENKRHFNSLGSPTDGVTKSTKTINVSGNNIVLEFVEITEDLFKSKELKATINDNCKKLKQLVAKINENSDTFAELEYLMRKTNMNDVKNYDLKLITNNIEHVSSLRSDMHWTGFRIIMEKNTPLAALGCVAQILTFWDRAIIESTPETAVVCHLFTSLCHKVGLDNVMLLILNESNDANWNLTDLTKWKELESGCLGVVTEQSDLDAAIDAFLVSPSAPSEYPWKLRRVLVQESIYNKFNNILSWKAKLKNIKANEEQLPSSLQKLCSSTYVFEDKTFLVDYSGAPRSDDAYIFVEAYRTTKELLTMAKAIDFFCLSLWSSDISEANEIAFNINSSITWVNDYGVFTSCAKSAHALYGIHYLQPSHNTFHNLELKNLHKSWSKLDLKKRRGIIFDAIDMYKETSNCANVEYANKIQDAVMNFDDKFIDIENGTTCVCKKETIGTIVVNEGEDVVDMIASMVLGNVIYVFGSKYIELFEMLKKQGLPVCVNSKPEPTLGVVPFRSIASLHCTKAVWTSFGTTFAN